MTSAQLLRSWYVLAVQPPGVVELLARTVPGALASLLRGAGLSESEVGRFQREIVEYGALPGALNWYQALPFSTLSTVGPVHVPTTHVRSDGDPTISRRGAELTAAYVHAPYELRVLSEVSHWIPTRAPGILTEIILDRTSGEAARIQR